MSTAALAGVDPSVANKTRSTGGPRETSTEHAARSMISAETEPSNVAAQMGADRVMFSVDWPFEDVGEGAQWIDSAEIGEVDRIKVSRANAIKLFKLPLR